MDKKFEVGKWYKNLGLSKNFIAKYKAMIAKFE